VRDFECGGKTLPVALPLIIAGISAAVGGTELGMNLAGVGQPSTGDLKKQEQDQLAQQQKQLNEERRKAILANLPNAQGQTSGYLTDTGTLNLAAIQAGLPGGATSGTGTQALQEFLGNKTSPVAQPQPNEQNFMQQIYGLNGGM